MSKFLHSGNVLDTLIADVQTGKVKMLEIGQVAKMAQTNVTYWSQRQSQLLEVNEIRKVAMPASEKWPPIICKFSSFVLLLSWPSPISVIRILSRRRVGIGRAVLWRGRHLSQSKVTGDSAACQYAPNLRRSIDIRNY